MDRSYIILGNNGLYYPALKDILAKNSFKEISIENYDKRDRVGLMYHVPDNGFKYDSRGYPVKSNVNSLLDTTSITAITNKGELFKQMKKYGGEEFIPKTKSLDKIKKVRKSQILIVKPTGNKTGGGKYNKIILNKDDLLSVKELYKTEDFKRTFGSDASGVVSTYINDPWTHNGKKMHLRMYFLVRIGENDDYYFNLWDKGKIITAAKPYEKNHYEDQNIHDSHMGKTDDDYNFPADLQIPKNIKMPLDEIIDNIMDQMIGATNVLGEIMRKYGRKRPETRFGYEIFGLDFLVSTENSLPKVYLLEANTKVAYGPVKGEKERIKQQTGKEFDPKTGPWSEKYKEFSRQYFSWMFDLTVNPIYNNLPPKSFIISGDTGLKHRFLRQVLRSDGFTEMKIENMTQIGFMHIEKLSENLCRYDKNAEAMLCALKSILSDKKSAIANKEFLHSNMKIMFSDIYTKHFAKTWSISKVPEYEKNNILILRPTGAGASCGKGIYISSNPKEFEQSIAEIQKEGKSIGLKNIIASKYILNPLLLKNKKFHVRMFFVVRVGPGWNNPFFHHLFQRGRIVTAKTEYKLSDWANKDIHDTHSESTDYNFWFPEDLPDFSKWEHIFNQMKNIVDASVKILRNKNVGPYPESVNAYEVFGCDFLITDDYNVILMEINDKVGYRNIGDIPHPFYTFDDFSKDYFSWIYKTVIHPLYTHTEPKEIQFSPISTYISDNIKYKISKEKYDETVDFLKEIDDLRIITETNRYTPIQNDFRIIDKELLLAGKRSIETKNYPLTYKISGDSGLIHKYLIDILIKKGFKQSEDNIGFLNIEWEAETSMYNKADTSLSCIVKSILGYNKTLITNKRDLYFNMNGKYMAETWDLNSFPKDFTDNKVYIVRPYGKGACCGRGISVITNNQELRTAVNKIEKGLQLKSKKGGKVNVRFDRNKIIVSKYIERPLLLNNKKFNLRMYYFVRPETSFLPFYSELWSRGKLFTARNNYENSNWNNPDIHDTHADSTPGAMWFPENLPDPSRGLELYEKMKKVMSEVDKISKNIIIYSESIFAYEIFGCDFLITEDYEVILMEINDHVGFDTKSPTFLENYTGEEFSRDVYNWLYNLAIKPIFFPNEPIIQLPNYFSDWKEIYKKNPHLIQRLYLNDNINPVFFDDFKKSFRILSSDSPMLDYIKIPHDKRSVNHWGQRKLLLSEIEFLTIYEKKYKKLNKTDPLIVVYAGAAPGKHINYLSNIFKDLIFHLYDPAPFKIKQSEKIFINPYGQTNGFFTDDIAKYYENFNTVFISDIRTGDPKVMNKDQIETAVKNDMEWQQNWVKIIKPFGSMLKFRLPWEEGKTNYLKGKIYLPVWGPQTTTETRLIVDKKDLYEKVLYDNSVYEKQMFYWNTHTRVDFYNNNNLPSGMDHCYDCAAELYILNKFLKYKHLDKNINDMVDEITKEISSKRQLSTKIDKSIQKKWFEGRVYDTEKLEIRSNKIDTSKINLYVTSLIKEIKGYIDSGITKRDLRYDIIKEFLKSYLLNPDEETYSNIIKEINSTGYKYKSNVDYQIKRADKKVEEIVKAVKNPDFLPRSILDVGAGEGWITEALADYYVGYINSKNIYALDPYFEGEVRESNKFKRISYKDGYKIPLDDNSIDLCILLVTLHHFDLSIRDTILSEISRVLSPQGYLVIREHADLRSSPVYYNFINILHELTYYFTVEPRSELNLMTRTETKELLSKFDLEVLEKNYFAYEERFNHQRLYYDVYIKKDNKNKYIFATQYLTDYNYILDKVMEKRGNWVKGDLSSDLSYVYIDGTNVYNRDLQKKKVVLKNLVAGKSVINDKEQLYQRFEEYNPDAVNKYMMKQYFVTTSDYRKIDKNIFDDEGVWIIKPVKEGAGKGIKVLDTYSKYLKYMESPQHSDFGFVLEEYIKRPLLIDNRKFHIRVFFLFFAGTGYIFKYGYILKAREDYKYGDWGNELIHDTHHFGLPFSRYPDDFIEEFGQEKSDEVFGKIKDIFYNVSQFTKLTCYSESKYCYEVFGGDIMITENFDVKLLEINKEIGLGPFEGKKWEEFIEWFIDGQLEVTLDIIIPPERSMKQLDYFTNVNHQISYNTHTIPTPYNTFIISGANGLDHQQLRSLMKHYGFSEVNIGTQPDFVGVMCLEQKKSKWDKRAFSINSFVKSLINDSKRAITNKSDLYFNLNNINPGIVEKHMASTRLVKDIKNMETGEVLIVKPVGDVGLVIGGGKDIHIVTSFKELKKIGDNLRKKYRTEPIASYYIPDPWLIENRKTHFRMYFLVRTKGVSISGATISYKYSLFNRGIILTAAEEFILGDYNNPRIHDTHNKSTDKDRYFGNEDVIQDESGMTLEQRKFVFQQMSDIMDNVGQIMLNNSKSYSESNNGYEVFGVDFMIRTPSLNVILIEINDHVGYDPVTINIPKYNSETGPWPREFSIFSNDYWNWVFKNGISPYFDQ